MNRTINGAAMAIAEIAENFQNHKVPTSNESESGAGAKNFEEKNLIRREISRFYRRKNSIIL